MNFNNEIYTITLSFRVLYTRYSYDFIGRFTGFRTGYVSHGWGRGRCSGAAGVSGWLRLGLDCWRSSQRSGCGWWVEGVRGACLSPSIIVDPGGWIRCTGWEGARGACFWPLTVVVPPCCWRLRRWWGRIDVTYVRSSGQNGMVGTRTTCQK